MSLSEYQKELVYKYYSSNSGLSGHMYCVGCLKTIESYDDCKIVAKVQYENLGKTSNMIPICPECAKDYKIPETIWDFIDRKQPSLYDAYPDIYVSNYPPEMYTYVIERLTELMKIDKYVTQLIRK